MPTREQDFYGAKQTTTEYEGQERPGSRRGRSRSQWAVTGLAIFLICIFVWVALRPPGSTDPAPAGTPATGIVRESGPTSNNP
ncbi:hypothetical protein ABID21_003553 [Pseudorhizobium tarimense]|uniref:Uncharacterized protein n=1 Tax=Pseudorhizobium tarimense TaxID=1079109 RepID=A0ABV2HA81_9HYPH|nr:hypothetical protein [Pseudorhizobium tarimense]MCJ8520567.1 hypothetical protein [Pseudorhizobium tarimense]